MGQVIIRQLAAAMLSGEWAENDVRKRCRAVVQTDGPKRWVGFLVKRVFQRFSTRPPRRQVLIEYLGDDLRLRRRMAEYEPFAVDLLANTATPVMAPARPGMAEWGLPELTTTGRLADWFGLTPSELVWLADARGLEARRTKEAQRHYRYRWLVQPGKRARLLEIPKRRLKGLQQHLLRELLSLIPVHEAAHAFRPGRSIRTYVELHTDQDVVIRVDLRDFFTNIGRFRISELLRTCGYPEPVADCLASLCTNVVPQSILEESAKLMGPARLRELSPRLSSPHLPQGAPSSPALANIVAYQLDARLSGLAHAWDARYTRYADDLLFSGGRHLSKSVSEFLIFVNAILLDEGFTIRDRKTRIMPRGTRQQAAGILVNALPNLPRSEFDRLKAILHNCIRFGPASQNRDGRADFQAHLLGSLGYWQMIHPGRAAKLAELYRQIKWDGDRGNRRLV